MIYLILYLVLGAGFTFLLRLTGPTASPNIGTYLGIWLSWPLVLLFVLYLIVFDQ